MSVLEISNIAIPHSPESLDAVSNEILLELVHPQASGALHGGLIPGMAGATQVSRILADPRPRRQQNGRRTISRRRLRNRHARGSADRRGELAHKEGAKGLIALRNRPNTSRADYRERRCAACMAARRPDYRRLPVIAVWPARVRSASSFLLCRDWHACPGHHSMNSAQP